jgi:uncharacterized protein (TIGR02680 family)
MSISRFRPSRAGIVNLWDYRDEEFVFVNGWLVLRGPNGSGKTKALEVLFPFLLDGRIEPRRLNPFASEERTMKSNLLFRGQEVSHAYAWMEFCRPPSAVDGSTEYVTIGIGLRAHRHVDKVTRWHFVVDGRVGVDFSLIDADDRPLNRRDLIAELGTAPVHDSGDDYRRAVDQRLFGLGPTRYAQLLDLVLMLRRPQLAKNLNPVELSRILQGGLRPLDDALIIEAARSFDDMEAVARTLEGLIAADVATTSFLSIYSTYLRTHARATADALSGRRDACARRHSAVDDSVAGLEAATVEWRRATESLRVAEGEPGRLRARLEALRSSAAYQSQQQLAGVRQHVTDLAAEAARAQAAVARLVMAVESRGSELARAQTAAADTTAELSRISRELGLQAEVAGIVWAPTEAQADDVATRLTGRIAARHDDLRAVRERLDQAARAEQEHVRANHELATVRAQVAAAEQETAAATSATDQARAETGSALVGWATEHAAVLDQLVVGPLSDDFDEVVNSETGRTLRDVLSERAAEGVARVQTETAELTRHRRSLDAHRDEVVAERDRIAAELDDAPPAAPTRPADRTGRAGAPLWRLVDFAPAVSVAEAAAVEAALEGAGLLDAWVGPTATVDQEQDGFLRPLPKSERPTGRTLADALVPEPNTGVPAATVEAVLASIAVRDVVEPTLQPAIDTSGRYSLGVLFGAYEKPTPGYIGASARAARRAARVAECEQVIVELGAAIADDDRRLGRLKWILESYATAVASLPSMEPVHAALRAYDRAATLLRLRREAETVASGALDQAVALQSAAMIALRRIEVDRSLPGDRVDEVEAATRRFETAGQHLLPARRAESVARRAVLDAQSRLDESRHVRQEAGENAETAAQRHREKVELYETLAAAVDDADSRRVLAEAEETEAAITQAEARLHTLRNDERDAYAAQATAGQRLTDARESLRIALDEAQLDALRLRPYAHADILGLLRCPTDLRWPSDVADGSLPPEVTALHEAILAVTKELSPTESSLKQSATRLTAALADLQAQLPAAGLDHRPEFDTDDGVIVVRIADELGLTPVAHFAERIAKDRHDQEQLLTDTERRIFEDALLTQLARQIHHRTIESRDLVESMDRAMRARRMSSGLTVGVGWQLSDELDADQREACKLLERDPARLGPAQLAKLRGHFASRIKATRAMAPDQTYRDLLAQVLDYRRWRVFAFTLHHPGGAVERLTRARHSQLSGGEQSVSLHLPLFAAANALFTSANPMAPRLIGLDEAFAGVDENGRAELMALATQFDLDLFMTGFDLWATHPGVSGAAHYDLAHSAVEHAIATVLITWNGSVTTADFDGTLARALGSPETRRAPGALSPGRDGDLVLELD